MPIITLAGDYKYDAQRLSDLAAGTTVDARTASFIQDNWAGDGGANNPYPLQVVNVASATIVGGRIIGQTDQIADWRTVYSHGNSAALRIENAPNAVIRDWRITNTWDAIRISWNSQNFLIEDVWITNARDDAIENDRLLSGVIKDSLFDGVFGGMSIDPSSASPVDGHNETVTMDGVLIRLQQSLYEGELTHASFIKTDSATPGTVTPNLRFINNVIAIEEVNHRSYRSLQDAWNNTVESRGNYYLNLSDTPLPADYPMPPAGWTILQGQAARDYWGAARDAWVDRHNGASALPTAVLTFVGTNGGDIILGNALDNTIYANGGDDTVNGANGNDMIFGAAGNDRLNGGQGSDSLYGGLGADQLVGGDGVGEIDYARYDDTNYGNLIIRLDKPSLNTGAALGDTFIGIEGVVGGAGNDDIYGNGLINYLLGGDGADRLFGQAGIDFLHGGAGSDSLYGGLGADQLVGGDGVGEIDYARYDDANYGNLTIRLDTPSLNTGAARGDTYVGIEGIVGGSGNDVIYGNGQTNYLLGSGGADRLFGQAGADFLIGGAGSDNLYGGLGADQVIGGNGVGEIDYARYDEANYGNLTIRLDRPSLNTGAARGDTYIGIEGIVGGAGNDTIYGNGLTNYLQGGGGSDRLFGQGGADFLNGGAGADILSGGLGADRLVGGNGSDFFRFDTALSRTSNVDIIVDFIAADDSILLDNAIFVGLGLVTGLLGAGAFMIGSAAKQTDDRIIYNSSSGALSYDADGTGNIAAIQFATLQGSPTISAADFFIV